MPQCQSSSPCVCGVGVVQDSRVGVVIVPGVLLCRVGSGGTRRDGDRRPIPAGGPKNTVGVNTVSGIPFLRGSHS